MILLRTWLLSHWHVIVAETWRKWFKVYFGCCV